MSRAQTFMLALLAMHVLLGVLSLVVARFSTHPRILREWGSGLLCYGAGALFVIAAPSLPTDLKRLIGNLLVCVAAWLTALALYRHTTVRLGRPAQWLGLLTALAFLLLNYLLSLGVILDVAGPTVYASVLYFVAGLGHLLRPSQPGLPATRLLGIGVLATVVVWILRLWVLEDALNDNADPAAVDMAVSIFAIAHLMLLVACTMALLWIEVSLTHVALQRTASTDPLTGLANRRMMHARFDIELARARHYHLSFALVVLDIDHFKRINDRLGHQAGDRVLCFVASVLEHFKHGHGLAGRIGGEEFMLLLPDEDRQSAAATAERLRGHIADAESAVDANGELLQVTLSGGVAVYPHDGRDWDSLFACADRRLYAAKAAGRDRVVSEDAVATAA